MKNGIESFQNLLIKMKKIKIEFVAPPQKKMKNLEKVDEKKVPTNGILVF